MIVVIIGHSGSGKTELGLACERVGIPRVITNTTRVRRISDKPDAYNFMSVEEFERKIKNGELLEYAVYNNHYYGISKDAIKEPCVVVVEPNGYYNLRKEYGDRVFMVYLEVTEEEIQRRLKARGDNVDIVNSRSVLDKELFTDELRNDADLLLTDIKLEEIPLIINKYKDIWLQKGGE